VALHRRCVKFVFVAHQFDVGAQSGRLPKTSRTCYYFSMTVLLEKAIESVRGLPAETQDSLALMLLQFVGVDQTTIELTAEEAASFDESIAQADRGEFATDEQVRSIWAKHGL
jgi:hypothetical protein